MVLKLIKPLLEIAKNDSAIATSSRVSVPAIKSIGLTMETLTEDVAILSKKIKGTNISAISSEREFIEVLNKLKSHRRWSRNWNIKGANNYETALMPYAGFDDISWEINEYLRFGKRQEVDYFLPDYILEDYIRMTDYALKGIDKTYGKYAGVVYRYGLMDAAKGKPTLSFVSTASTPEGAVSHADKLGRYLEPYNIIFTKHGHKIENMQKNLARTGVYSGFTGESEILLDPGTRYEQITEITPEMKKLQQELYSIMQKEFDQNPEGLAKVCFYKEV